MTSAVNFDSVSTSKESRKRLHAPANVSSIPWPASVCWNSLDMKPSPSPLLLRIAKWIANMAM